MIVKSSHPLTSYQIHAIESVQDASRRQESGYIWHAGSGRPLTLLQGGSQPLQIPAIQRHLRRGPQGPTNRDVILFLRR
ncbi:MAG: hypothetical protein ACLRX9_02480 [Streptococcus salivarius]